MPILNFQQFAAVLQLIDGRVLERLDALEAGSQQPQPLAQRNAKRQAEGERLQRAIRQILDSHPGPRRLPAKRVWQELADTDVGRAERPSLRTVQHHITQLRKTDVLRVSDA